MQRLSPWTAEQDLSELTLNFDWDSTASMIAMLRVHLYEYGTVPTWNFGFCAGRPELAAPISWAYTWPSLVAYALPPNHAVIALWLVMTAVGFLATRAFLLRRTGSRAAAALGACVYAFSGYFAARFNVGHAGFAFFHLVPVLVLLFDVAFERQLRRESSTGALILGVFVAYLFFSAGQPHGLVYFYPAVLGWAAVRLLAAATGGGWRRALRGTCAALLAQVLGALLAAHKLWPMLRWQLAYPREAIEPAANSAASLLLGTVSTVSGAETSPSAPWRFAFEWETYAFVGPLPWVLAVAAILVVVLRPRKLAGGSGDASALAYALVLVATGLALGLGRTPVDAGGTFPGLALLSGIRGFGRYQVLVVFGLSILASLGLVAICSRVVAGSRVVPALLVIATAVPVLAQSGLLVWQVSAIRNAEILAHYPSRGRRDPPELVGARPHLEWEAGHQSALIGEGLWVANCYTNLAIPGPAPFVAAGQRLALSDPPPERIRYLHGNELALDYEAGRRVELNLRLLGGFELNVPVARRGDRLVIRAADQSEGFIRIRASYPGMREGMALSGVAALVSALVLCVHWLSTRRVAPGPLRPAGSRNGASHGEL